MFDYDMNEIYNYVYHEFKIKLDAYKPAQMNRRIETLISKIPFETSKEFIRACGIDSKLRDQFLDLITINVTEFFRNMDIFSQVKDLFKKNIPKRDVYKIWSAACSNGSEPYSVAMILDHAGIKNYRILATDIDKKVLDYAENGCYKKDELGGVPLSYFETYFEKYGDNYKVKDFLRDKIMFKKHDLILDDYSYGMDLILCRNVVIYFKREEQVKIYNKFYDHLNDKGVVFIGATENIYDYQQIGFNKLGTFFYQKVVK